MYQGYKNQIGTEQLEEQVETLDKLKQQREAAEASGKQAIQDRLIERLGGLGEYLKWSNKQTLRTHMNDRTFIEAAQKELNRLEGEPNHE